MKFTVFCILNGVVPWAGNLYFLGLFHSQQYLSQPRNSLDILWQPEVIGDTSACAATVILVATPATQSIGL